MILQMVLPYTTGLRYPLIKRGLAPALHQALVTLGDRNAPSSVCRFKSILGGGLSQSTAASELTPCGIRGLCDEETRRHKALVIKTPYVCRIPRE